MRNNYKLVSLYYFEGWDGEEVDRALNFTMEYLLYQCCDKGVPCERKIEGDSAQRVTKVKRDHFYNDAVEY